MLSLSTRTTGEKELGKKDCLKVSHYLKLRPFVRLCSPMMRGDNASWFLGQVLGGCMGWCGCTSISRPKVNAKFKIKMQSLVFLNTGVSCNNEIP